MTSKFIQSSSIVLALTAATMLGACGRTETRDDMRTSDGTSTTSNQQVSPAAAPTVGGSSESVSTTVGDMAITASVKTRLAADSQLSALAIDVDTNAGRLALRGTAPDSAARSHATELARKVDGVVDVDNALTVQTAAK